MKEHIMLVKKVFVFFIISLSLTCRPFKRYGKGSVREIVVITDNAERILPLIEPVLAEIFFTPRTEKLFSLIIAELDSLKPYLGYRNTLLIASPGMKTWDMFQDVFQGKKGFLLRKGVVYDDDHWFGIGADNWGQLQLLIKQSLPIIKDSFMSWAYQNYREREYFSGHNKKVREYIKKRWKIDIDVPDGWAFFAEKENFFALAKHYPDRFFFVYKEDFPKPLEINEILNLRDQLTRKYYEGDYTIRKNLKIEKTSFLGYPALKIIGVWQNDSLVIGGPFMLYAFNRNNQRFTMIDVAAFVPEEDYKLPYLFRIETIVKTVKFLD